jgi:Uma2 family endonuclease
MSATLLQSLVGTEPPRKLWTRAELDAIYEAGLLADTKLELIEGELFDKMGQNPPHASAVMRVAMLLIEIFSASRVRPQLPAEPSPADAPNSLPLPDVLVTREPEPAYRKRHPGPGDILLLVEVADTTYIYDTKRKAKLYARAGFPEYLVLDLQASELLVFRSPRRGTYSQTLTLQRGDSYTPPGTDKSIAISDLLAE